jgi:hypothetical protein
MENKIIIDCGELKYFSQLDEYLFFTGLSKIRAVVENTPISIAIDPKMLTKIQYHALSGLLKRFFPPKRAQKALAALKNSIAHDNNMPCVSDKT